ncbi:hypothetical protein K4A83_21090 [Spirulina subsalsa FACHB-351]|uniref:Uncharacterized protein n=1 Tax=Spirulina subsalsa FACHB-351 TaxID=234711 RepID=A0ABT3LB58_9CYAN|nr:hypothetical protein [Spirulina subsalsa]MCW6038746.1 hypothetical protein [Spirulina subsalsa FACHB-351]
MEMLGYNEMVVLYESHVGSLEVRTLTFPKTFNLKQLSTAAALIGFIFFGGFTAVVATTLARPGQGELAPQEIPLP